MKISVQDLQTAAYWLETEGAAMGEREDRAACRRAADYLRFVADQREEYAATRPASDPRMDSLKNALQKVWSARAARTRG